jgi:protein ImuB
MYACIHAPGFGELAACCHDFSPHVEEVAPGTVLFAIGGLDRLYGPPEQIAAAVARRVGPHANIAVARSPDAAIHAARGLAGVTVIPAGEEARFLGDLPIELLSPPPEIEDTLRLWGIRTFRDLTALPQDGVAERLGPEGVRLQQSARGNGSRPLATADSPSGLEETTELDYPLTLLEPLSFILARHLHAICATLETRSLATNELRLRLKLEDKSEHARTFRLPYPMHDRAALLKLIQLDLDANPPCAPVVAVSLAAEPAPPRVIQHGLFVPVAPEPQKLELTLARIARLVGARNVGSPELLDTHRPDAFRMGNFGAWNFGPDLSSGLAGRGPAPLNHVRIFRPPLRAQVKTASGQPKQILAPRVCGEVVRAAGPWRSSGEWWRQDAWSRDEWDVAIASGAVYRIYFDRRTSGWFVEGNYD